MKIAPKLMAAGVALAAMSVAPSVASASMKVEVKAATVAKFGKILEDQAGLPLYYDTAVKPPSNWACKGSCLAAWPPLVLSKSQKTPVVAHGVTGISTVKGPSGVQVTWHGKPLYTFVRDRAGHVNGQGIGGVWYVVKASAKAATKAKTGYGY
jgi:predicted lipoprotein with Yx(FWY)xxD motif